MNRDEKIRQLGLAVGKRRSARRESILAVLHDSDGALTPDEIHRAASRLLDGLGIATVYRNLKLLHEAKVIQEVLLPDGVGRYELADQKHHHHFHCTVCGRIFCLEGCVMAESALQLPRGFKAVDHEITLYGQCSNCH